MNSWFKPDLPMEPKVWFICFGGMKQLSPWDWFLRPGYRHAFMLGYVPAAGIWIRYEVLFHRTEISLISSQVADLLLTAAQGEGGVLTWRVGEAKAPSWGLRFGLWCVPAIKHVLGVRCVALTPRGLHQWLLRNGAQPLLPEEKHEPVFSPESAAGRPGD